MKKLFVTLVLLGAYSNVSAMEHHTNLNNRITLPSAPIIQQNIDNFLSLLSIITPDEIQNETQNFFSHAHLHTKFANKNMTPLAIVTELRISCKKDLIPQICNIMLHKHPTLLEELEKTKLIEKQMRYALNPLETVITLPSNASLEARISTLTNSAYLNLATTNNTNTIGSFFINRIKPLLDENPTSAANIISKLRKLEKDFQEVQWVHYIYTILFCEHPFIIAALTQDNIINEQHLKPYLWNALQSAYGNTAKARFFEPFKIEEKNKCKNTQPLQQHPFSTQNPEFLLKQVNDSFDKILW